MASGESPEPLYRVTSQQETVDRTPGGEYVNGIRIAYTTRSGAYGSVFIPMTDYTLAKAKAALDARAAEAEAIHNL